METGNEEEGNKEERRWGIIDMMILMFPFFPLSLPFSSLTPFLLFSLSPAKQ